MSPRARSHPSPAGGDATRSRPQLDPDLIVETAMQLSGGGTTQPLTVRRLGNELGADPTAIYRHFRDKDALVMAVLDRLVAGAVEQVDTRAGWRDRLTEFTDLALSVMHQHPHIAAMAGARTTNGPGELDAIELIIVAMDDAGLDRDDSVRFYAVLSSYVISFISAQASSMLIGERDAEARWIGVTPLLHQSTRPAIVNVRDELESLGDRDVFTTGVQVILDAVEARVEHVRSAR